MPDEKPLLILDLDETLIFGTESRLARAEDFKVGPYFIYRRPGIERFLVDVASHYQLAIWSSATAGYVWGIAQQIALSNAEFRFVWARDRCTRKYDLEWQEEVWLKNLKKVKRLGYRLERMLIVDDTASKVATNYGNAIYVQPWLGVGEDDELPLLARYLVSIADQPQFRELEKRGWRQRAQQLLMDHE